MTVVAGENRIRKLSNKELMELFGRMREMCNFVGWKIRLT